MSTSGVLDQFLTQLLGQSPTLVVYLIGLVLALAFWGRHPTPCLLTFLATALLMLTTVGVTWLQLDWIRGANAGASSRSIAERLQMLAIVSGFVRAGAMGLLIWAVFSGRTSHAAGGFPVGMPGVPRPPALPPKPPLGERW
jgi:hypothetical protein